ncbi:MAG: methylmalonyl Co-A mutase-associated GTPase MeaB [Bacteroidales bacterium]|nr:methylmalonyl Co-A mutase-associated GTPase MeaB [Bacteroidales bacterium]MCF8454395.1 methylmalonyl Co-A mutase-associated GTPase MeaB [Bacteroidales bacterium]
MQKESNRPHIENSEEFKALKVNEGIERPPALHPDSVKRFKSIKRRKLSVDDFVEGIRNNNRSIFSQAITLVESNLPDHQIIAQEIIERCLPLSGNSIRVGITGVPGVGKSSFIETLGLHLMGKGRKLAVLAIDPSSEKTKGSILGDKTRMEQLSNEPNAYIRPSPSSGSLGGVAQKTRETIILCEAAGYDTIFIETVGVGQSETVVHSMVDFFLLLMLGGAGDELQGIKRGIMEMADAISINKADGDNIKRAERAKTEYQAALHLFPLGESKWTPTVLTCSAYKNTGIVEVWDTILKYSEFVKSNQYFSKRRNEQAKYWMHQSIEQTLKSHFYKNEHLKKIIIDTEKKVIDKELSPFVGAKKLLDEYFNG